jgi:thiol-disulfide isomerase/thioredoxin
MIEPMYSPSSQAPSLLIACLCAQWCGICRNYRPLFEQLQAEFGTARFAWVDVEDEADLVDPIDVEDFPTLLIASSGQARFFGTLTPHLETLRRLVQSQLESPSPPLVDATVQALTQRLLARA